LHDDVVGVEDCGVPDDVSAELKSVGATNAQIFEGLADDEDEEDDEEDAYFVSPDSSVSPGSSVSPESSVGAVSALFGSLEGDRDDSVSPESSVETESASTTSPEAEASAATTAALKWSRAKRGLPVQSNEEVEKSPEDEMDGLIGRMSAFGSRVDEAQTSKSVEAINARFFAGLDDDEDEEEDGDIATQLGAALGELMEKGKVPDNLAKLLKKTKKKPVTQLDVDGGLDEPVKKKERVHKDPPAVITSYGDIAGSSNRTNENPIVLLSRFNFQENVMSKREDQVEHWMIRFCHDWYSPCERILPAYKELAWKTEKDLNQEGLKTIVRFADIDCSTDKPLCNEQNAETFPKIIHYGKGKNIGEWEGGNGKLSDQEEMKEWMEIQVKKILKAKVEESQGVASKDAKTTALLTQENLSLVWSVLSIVVTLLAHTWLVRSRPHGPAAKKEGNESSKDLQKAKKPVDSPGPSGMGSMLPEEWVTKASGGQLIEL